MTWLLHFLGFALIAWVGSGIFTAILYLVSAKRVKENSKEYQTDTFTLWMVVILIYIGKSLMGV